MLEGIEESIKYKDRSLWEVDGVGGVSRLGLKLQIIQLQIASVVILQKA